MNTFKHILVPTDFSASSSRAVEVAIGMAKRFDAELTLLHVWELPAYPYMEAMTGPADVTASMEKAATEALQTQLLKVQAELPRAKSVLKLGLPWQQIADTIKDAKADLVIMGTHGRRGFEHLLLGSVAEKLVRLSTVPVLTVRASSER
jgi:nucleotide-binding universal stress UspA family protein